MIEEVLNIYKLNEYELKIDCNIGQRLELKEFTSFYAENYKFHPKFKARIWNGKVSYFNYGECTVPIGLLPEILKFCERYHYKPKFNFDTNSLVPKQISDDELNSFYVSLFKGTKYYPRDYQHDAIKAAINNNRGIILSPTGCLSPDSKILCKVSKADLEYLVIWESEWKLDKKFVLKNVKSLLMNEVELTFEQIKFLNEKNKKVFIQSPTGFVKVTDSYEKFGAGYELIWSDGTKTLCRNSHRLLNRYNEWMTAEEIEIGEIILGKDYRESKTLISKNETEQTNWIDFSVDSKEEEYLQNGLVHHNSGKSLIIYALIRYLLAHGKKIILVVPNVSLVNQMYSDFVDYGWYKAFNHVEKLYSGQKPIFNKEVLITTFQSLMNKQVGFFKEYDAMLNDEAHSVKSFELQKIAKKCINAKTRIGFTGTMPKNDSDRFNIQGALGPIIFKHKTKDLMDVGVLSKIRIANCFLKYPKEIDELGRRRAYNDEIRLIEECDERNRVFKYIFNNMPDSQNSIILVNRRKHLDLIADYIENNLDDKFKLYIIHGDIKPDDRELIRKTIDNEENVILLATYGTVSTGINIKRVHNVILGSSSKSEIRVLQTIGRGLRLHKNKDGVVIWDIVDDFSYVNRNKNLTTNHVYKHWEERFKYYTEQEFPCFRNNIYLDNIK